MKHKHKWQYIDGWINLDTSERGYTFVCECGMKKQPKEK